jgi:hypothetical protein
MIGCSKKDSNSPIVANKPVKILVLQVDASYITAKTDNWVLIHDVDGKLLEYKAFETGNIITIETEKEIQGNKVNITLFEYFNNDTISTHILESYLGNELGQEWVLRKKTFPPLFTGNIVGEVTFNVSGIPSGSTYEFSNKNQIVFFNGGWSGTRLNADCPLYDNGPDYLFYMADGTETPKYKFFKNVKDKDVFNIHYNDLNFFDKTVKVDFPLVKARNIEFGVNTYDANSPGYWNGFTLSSNFSNLYSDFDMRKSLTLGYLDTFSLYNTYVNIGHDSIIYRYGKLGAKPDSIGFSFGAKFKLKDKSFTNFDFELDRPFSKRMSYWYYRDLASNPINHIIERVYAPSQTQQKMSEWPAEFTTKYPTLSLNKGGHNYTQLTTKGESYADYIDKTFKGKATDPNYEHYEIEIK